MSIKIDGYSRRPFHVDAVQVTVENMEEVAAWCAGDIRTGNRVIRDENNKILERKEVSFIKVNIRRPLNERQTKAHCGDWVLLSDAGFKVYTGHAFEKAFEIENDGLEKLPEESTFGPLGLDIPEITLTLEGAKA